MTPRRAIQISIAKTVFVHNRGVKVVGIDKVRLLTSLLTFDEIVLECSHFGELPFLVKLFGFSGLIELMDKGILRITSEVTSLVLDTHINGKRELPLNSFPQMFISQQGTAEQCEHGLSHTPGLTQKKREVLVQQIVKNDLCLPSDFGRKLHQQIIKDLDSNGHLVHALLLRDNLTAPLGSTTFQLSQKRGPRGSESLEIISNLMTLFGINQDTEHQILRGLYGAIGNLNIQLAKMEKYAAIPEFEEADAPLLFGKLQGIIAPYNPAITQDAFVRVLTLADMPQTIESSRVDVERLLQIRDTHECREFRLWLSTTDNISDVDLKRLLTGFKARAGYFLSSTPGKTLRFVTNTAIGLVPGVSALVPMVEGVVDTFLLDRMLPSSGILSFIKGSIPSMLQ